MAQHTTRTGLAALFTTINGHKVQHDHGYGWRFDAPPAVDPRTGRAFVRTIQADTLDEIAKQAWSIPNPTYDDHGRIAA